VRVGASYRKQKSPQVHGSYRYSTSPKSIQGIVFSQRNSNAGSLLASLPREKVEG
jgi:hypothetical protein